MNFIIRMLLLNLLIVVPVYADKFGIKINGKQVELPHWSAQKKAYGAVVLINGREQPQWSIFLADLAQKLSASGWSTLLLNCNQDDSESWQKELPEVLTQLRQQKNNRILVVHYGEQLKESIKLFDKNSNPDIEGLVFLSAYDTTTNDATPKLSMPVLDVAGQFDYQPVLSQYQKRQKSFSQNNYQSFEIPGAQHDYEYSRQFLISFIHGWMLKRAEFKVPPVLASYIPSIAALKPKLIAFEDVDWDGFLENLSESSQDLN